MLHQIVFKSAKINLHKPDTIRIELVFANTIDYHGTWHIITIKSNTKSVHKINNEIKFKLDDYDIKYKTIMQQLIRSVETNDKVVHFSGLSFPPTTENISDYF